MNKEYRQMQIAEQFTEFPGVSIEYENLQIEKNNIGNSRMVSTLNLDETIDPEDILTIAGLTTNESSDPTRQVIKDSYLTYRYLVNIQACGYLVGALEDET